MKNNKEDLQEEIDKIWNACDPIDEGMGVETANIHIEQFEDIARHFVEWQKEQHNRKYGFLNLKDCKDAYNEWKSTQDNPSAALAWVRACEWQKQKDLEDFLKSDMIMPNKFYEKGRVDAMNEMKETLQTEYEKGRFDIREEMMKDAVECVVEDWCGNSPEITIPLNSQGFKNGDNVKIIIVKEEKK